MLNKTDLTSQHRFTTSWPSRLKCWPNDSLPSKKWKDWAAMPRKIMSRPKTRRKLQKTEPSSCRTRSRWRALSKMQLAWLKPVLRQWAWINQSISISRTGHRIFLKNEQETWRQNLKLTKWRTNSNWMMIWKPKSLPLAKINYKLTSMANQSTLSPWSMLNS